MYPFGDKTLYIARPCFVIGITANFVNQFHNCASLTDARSDILYIREKQMSNPYDKSTITHSSVLGPTLKFKGKLTANENLLIHGQVDGSIEHSSLLTIGKEGKLKADVSAEYIAIEGKVVGDLSGATSVVVNEGADVKGNINSPKVTLRDGAVFNGNIDMTGKQQPKAATPDKDAANDEPRRKRAANDGDKAELADKKSASA